MFQLLVADDEKEIRNLLRLYLENAGYAVLEAANGREALELMEKEKIDLCLLDIMMPEIDGYRVLQQIRQNRNIPVIILSAKDQDADKILGLDLGADDYITKPFNPLEAVARVNSCIRRFTALGGAGGSAEVPKLTCRDLTLDQNACILYRGDEPISLTASEFRIMSLFMENPGRVFTKMQLSNAGWGDEAAVSDNSVMVCISKLREKISPENPYSYIRTIRGLGYRLEEERHAETV